MSRFESGVTSYIHATATVNVYFPVDAKGNADICCKQCPYYRYNNNRCGLNEKICSYPEKYVGAACPLNQEEV